MNDLDDLTWLAAAQPDTAPPEPIATRRARRALDRHMIGQRLPALVSPAVDAPRAERRWQRPASVLALASAAAAALVAAVVLSGRATPTAAPIAAGGVAATVTAPAQSAAELTLVALANRVLAEPAPAGDATLIRRVQHYPDGTSYGIFDLYADGGRYYIGETRATLATSIADGADSYDGDATMRRQLVAAVAATTLDPDAARQRFIDATWAGGHPPAHPRQVGGAREQKLDASRVKAPENLAHHAPASKQSIDDNRIWGAAMDTLVAGAGRRDVRAGILRLLATMPHVSVVTNGSLLELSNTDFPDSYVETLVLDARGVPTRMVGGTAGKSPSVIITYAVSRVTVASLRAH